MKTVNAKSYWWLVNVALLVGGCSGGNSPSAEDERGSVGPANPASEYCAALGYKPSSAGGRSLCTFPDATSCEQWAFFRGECGKPFSYCNQHGGSIANEVVNQGGFVTSEGICTVGSVKCPEASFYKARVCK